MATADGTDCVMVDVTCLACTLPLVPMYSSRRYSHHSLVALSRSLSRKSCMYRRPLSARSELCDPCRLIFLSSSELLLREDLHPPDVAVQV